VLVLALAELFVLIGIGRLIGAWWTIALLVAESLAGIWVVKHEGRRAWNALRTALVSGELPDRQLADAALVMLGGILLLTPGFITDVAGFALMLPPTRRLARPLVSTLLARQARSAVLRAGGLGGVAGMSDAGRPRRPGARDDVISGDVISSHDEPLH